MLLAYPRKLITAPTAQVVSVDSLRLQCRLGDSSESADDEILYSLGEAAERLIERDCSIALMAQQWDIFPLTWPYGNFIQLPLGELKSLDAFAWILDGQAEQSWTVSGSSLLSGSVVKADIDSVCRRVVLASGQSWPSGTLKTSNPIRIRITSGWDQPAKVPAVFQQAIKLLVGHWFRNAETAKDGQMYEIPNGYESLIYSERLHIA